MVKVAVLPLVDNNDITHSIQKALTMTILEVGLAIIVACIPVLRPLFKNSMAAKVAHQSRYMSRTYSTVPFTSSKTNNGFTELYDLAGQSDPLPMRPDKTYYSSIEATGRSSEDRKHTEDLEMGGITVKKEFSAKYVLALQITYPTPETFCFHKLTHVFMCFRVEVVQVCENGTRTSMRSSHRVSIQRK